MASVSRRWNLVAEHWHDPLTHTSCMHQVSYDGACPQGAVQAVSPGAIASDHQAGLHGHIGSAISQALDRLRPLHEPPRVSTPNITAASLRASGCIDLDSGASLLEGRCSTHCTMLGARLSQVVPELQ